MVVPEITASQVRFASPSKMPLKSPPVYASGCRVRPSCAQIARISSMSKPPAEPSLRSNGGSG
jgi:hypothetical protein